MQLTINIKLYTWPSVRQPIIAQTLKKNHTKSLIKSLHYKHTQVVIFDISKFYKIN